MKKDKNNIILACILIMAYCPECEAHIEQLYAKDDLVLMPTASAYVCPNCEAVLGTVATSHVEDLIDRPTDDESHDTDSSQELAEDIAIAKNSDLEPVEEPFEPLIKELGLSSNKDEEEQILIYRESPDRQCFICEENIPEHGRTLEKGEEYIIERENEADSPFPLVERTFHTECWKEYQNSSS